MQCGTCKHWFCHAPIDVIYGVAWGKCMLAQEKSRETFCCGSWTAPAQVENDSQSRIASLESQLASRDALIERLVDCGDALNEVIPDPEDNGIELSVVLWNALKTEWEVMKGGEG